MPTGGGVVTVTGATYKHTRVRGMAPWSPRPATRALLDQVAEVLDIYADQLPLTGRQIFYVLVGRFGFDKSERSAEKLGEVLNRGRRAGLIPFGAIRDDGKVLSHPPGFHGMAGFWSEVRGWAEGYDNLDALTEGQPVAVELWCEAAGMVPQLERIAHPLGVLVASGGGFHSVSDKYDAARRVYRRDRPTVVLQVGDHDPSGCSILDSAAEDIAAFVADLGQPDPGWLRFARLAVTSQQVERYGLPSAPAKSTDRRGDWSGGTVQAEALSPRQLADEVRDGLGQVLDSDAIAAAEVRSLDERDTLLTTLDLLTLDG
jgi:hypothetical protein